MARVLMHYSGAVYHVMLRGNRKQTIFHDTDDHLTFEGYVTKSLAKYAARCHAYCWMPNHVHLLLEVGETPLSFVVHHIASGYAHAYNKKYDLVGHLFQGRYLYEHVRDDAYLTTAARYIHLNPVEAKIVKMPGDYRWSSFRAYFGQVSAGLVTTRLVLSTFSSDPPQAREAFYALHTADDGFVPAWERIEDEDDGLDPPLSGEAHIPTLDGLLEDAVVRFGHSLLEIVGPGRQRSVVSARAWIARQAQLTGCASLSEVARRVNRSPQAITQLAAKLEKLEKLENL